MGAFPRPWRALAVPALCLAACTVNVEGAPCTVPGTTVDCPDKQACGNDLRCSTRALDCKTTGTMCAPSGWQCNTSTEVTERCDGGDPVCGVKVTDDCGARHMVCKVPPGSGACECPDPSSVPTTVTADPGGSPDPSKPPYPRGQASPRECSFGRLADAIAALSPTVPGTVEIAGAAGAPVVFGSATGESWPLTIPANVTVRAALAPAGPTIVRAGPDPGAAGTLLRVSGTLDGVRVEGRGATGTGVELVCGAAGVPALLDVAVDGGATLDASGVVTAGLRAGISVTGTCGGLVQRALVTAISGPGLAVEASAGAGAVQVLGGTFADSEVGIWLRGGTTNVGPDASGATTVYRNAWMGIAIGGGPDPAAPAVTIPGATIDRATVNANKGTGVVVARLVEAGSFVNLLDCSVSENGKLPRVLTRPTGTPAHPVGGVLLALASSGTFPDFTGNTLWANGGDQLVIDSGASWSIGPTPSDGCSALSNAFACVTNGYALALVGGGSVTSAPYNVWPGPDASGTPWNGFLGPGVTQPPGPSCNGNISATPKPPCPPP